MSETQFSVRRLGWHQAPHGDYYTRRLPTTTTVAQFDNFDEAEYRRRALEHEIRLRENPFRFGGAALYFQSSLDIPRLHDWLLDIGIDPPVEQLRHRDWHDWWAAFSHNWNEEQLHHAWQGLDKVRFFDVVEEPREASTHLVMEIGFVETRNGSQNAEREGGRPEGVFRHARGANAACARLNAARREATFDWWRYRYIQRLGYDERDREPSETVFFEVVEVPGELPEYADTGFLMQRRAFDPTGFVCHDHRGRDTQSRVPVRLFADRAAAESHRDDLTEAAHAVMNPFQVFPPVMAGLGEVQFAAWVEWLRPPLPTPTNFSPASWKEWWDLCQDDVTDEQRLAAWKLFEVHPLFEVLPITIRD